MITKVEYNPVQTTPFTTGIKIKIRFWQFINKTLFRFSPFFARKFRVVLVKLFGANVDWSCSLDNKTIIDLPWNLTMNEMSSTGEGSWIYCLDKITIGKNTCIGKNVFLITGSHDIQSKNFTLMTKPIVIGSGVWISTGAYILPGITIGDYSVIATAALVSKNVDSWSVVGGNPAKFIKKREIKD